MYPCRNPHKRNWRLNTLLDIVLMNIFQRSWYVLQFNGHSPSVSVPRRTGEDLAVFVSSRDFGHCNRFTNLVFRSEESLETILCWQLQATMGTCNGEQPSQRWCTWCQWLTVLVYDDSWLKVLKTKKRLFELVEAANSQQTDGFAWEMDLHSMPFDSLGHQNIWNDAFYLMWNESLNYTITSRKPLPSDTLADICAICRQISENDDVELILCDGCPKMFHLKCLSMSQIVPWLTR